MGISPDYDDDVERRHTSPALLPKSEAEGVSSKQNQDVLKRAMGSDDIQENKRDVNSKSILPAANTVANKKECVG